MPEKITGCLLDKKVYLKFHMSNDKEYNDKPWPHINFCSLYFQMVFFFFFSEKAESIIQIKSYSALDKWPSWLRSQSLSRGIQDVS